MRTIEKDTLPQCDFCERDAEYDAPTKDGPWAYMCEHHFRVHASANAPALGTKLVKRTLKVVQTPEKIKSVMVPMTLDDIAEVSCPYCGTSRTVEPDANYTVTCEGCGHKYKIYSMI